MRPAVIRTPGSFPGSNLANGPKPNGPFIPLAVGAYIMAWGTMGGPFDGASMNPARSFGPDLAVGNLSTWWLYLIGPVAGAMIAVGLRPLGYEDSDTVRPSPALAGRRRYRSPLRLHARRAAATTVTGWFWADGCSQQRLSGTGTRA
jgi:Major intrinsic protein